MWLDRRIHDAEKNEQEAQHQLQQNKLFDNHRVLMKEEIMLML